MNPTNEKPIVFMLVVGFVISLFGAFFAWDYVSFIDGTTSVDGQVISVESKPGNKGTTVYAPTVRYMVNGVELTNSRKDFTNMSKSNVGDVVKVIYKIDQPHISRVYHWATFYMPMIISLGGPLLILSALVSRRRQTRHP